jgi:hypothetical protein
LGMYDKFWARASVVEHSTTFHAHHGVKQEGWGGLRKCFEISFINNIIKLLVHFRDRACPD